MSGPSAHQPEARSAVRACIRSLMVDLELAPACDSWITGASPEFSRRLAAAGYVGMTIPAEYGGRGGSVLERHVVVEELLAAGAPVAAHWFAERQVAPALLRLGTPEQRSKYLPGIAAGELYFSIGMSEPESGSDLASVSTRAERVAGGWRITGTKIWTGHAHYAHHILLLARTADAARHGGLSQFLVDLDTAGIEVTGIPAMDGRRYFNRVDLDAVFVPDEALLGIEGEGWSQVTAELATERSGPERFLSVMPLLAELIASGAARDDHRLGEVIAELKALRALSWSLAAGEGGAADAGVRAALVKDLGTRFERRVVDVARDALPSRLDPSSPDPVRRLLAEAVLQRPGATLRGGANEVLRGITAKSLVTS